MKKALLVLACLSIVGSHAYADPTTTTTTTTKKKRKKQATITDLTPTAAAPVSTYNEEQPRIRFGASGSLGMDDGNFGFGAGFRADYPIKIEELNFRAGAETGVYYFVPTGGSVVIIPIAVQGSYAFTNIPGLNDITPYAGLSLGIDVTIAKANGVTVLGTSVGSVSDTSAKFHFVLEPGIEFDHHLLFAELPFGAFGGGFLLMPTFGIHF